MSFLPATLAALDGTRYFGIDLAKRESQLAVLDTYGESVFNLRFLTTRSNLLDFAADLREGDVVALEVTTNATNIARILRDHSKARIILSNPIKTRVIAEAKVKTDKIDARVLAELARAEYLPEVWLPDDDTEALRQLYSDRRSLVDHRTELKNTVHSILHRNLVVYEFADLFGTTGLKWLRSLTTLEPIGADAAGAETQDESARLLPLAEKLRLRSLLDDLLYSNGQVEQADASIAAFVLARPEKKQQLDLLLSIPGVSLVVGAGFLAAIGDVSRFKSPKHLASYFGLTPTTYQSGDAPQRHGRISKRGRADGRWLAVEAAEHLAKAPGVLRQFYARIKKKKGRNVAVCAVARKLVELAWHLLTKKQTYIYALPGRTEDKRSRVRFIAKQKIGLDAPSATEARVPGRSALYGTGLRGKKLKIEITRQAALEAEARYLALTTLPKSETGGAAQIEGFDPRSPQQQEWAVILREVAARIDPERGKTASKTPAVKNVAEPAAEAGKKSKIVLRRLKTGK
jgi:transposase